MFLPACLLRNERHWPRTLAFGFVRGKRTVKAGWLFRRVLLKSLQIPGTLKLETGPQILRRTDDGLDGEIFVFKNLAVGVHTTSTLIVLLLFRFRSFPFLRQTGQTPSAKSDDGLAMLRCLEGLCPRPFRIKKGRWDHLNLFFNARASNGARTLASLSK